MSLTRIQITDLEHPNPYIHTFHQKNKGKLWEGDTIERAFENVISEMRDEIHNILLESDNQYRYDKGLEQITSIPPFGQSLTPQNAKKLEHITEAITYLQQLKQNAQPYLLLNE